MTGTPEYALLKVTSPTKYILTHSSPHFHSLGPKKELFPSFYTKNFPRVLRRFPPVAEVEGDDDPRMTVLVFFSSLSATASPPRLRLVTIPDFWGVVLFNRLRVVFRGISSLASA